MNLGHQEQLEQRLEEFEADAMRVLDRAHLAKDLVAKGDLQGACNAVSLAPYSLEAVQNDCNGLMETFEKMGIQPRS
jgi:hypothetical protein